MAYSKMIMPQMGESVAEGTVAKWLKKVGEFAERDSNILEITTDKIDVEVPTPQEGYIREILVDEGVTVEVGTPIAIVADTMEESIGEFSKDAPEKKETEVEEEAEEAPAKMKNFFTPVVARMAAEHNIDLGQVTGTGYQGRVTKKDVLKYLELLKKGETPEIVKETETVASPAAARPVSKITAADGRVEIIEMNNIRKKTAEHMVMSKQTSPHVHSMQEVDVTNIVNYRRKHKNEFLDSNGFPLSLMAIVTKEVCEAIKEFPLINSSVEADKILMKKDINIGMAVALPDETLIVPVIKNADHLNVTGISGAIWDLAERARNRKLGLDDIQGGTFTITNHGVFGSVFGTPIISQPQVAILGTGAFRKRPVVVDHDGVESIAVRTMMFLSLGYDHRIIDGGYGGKFCATIAQRLESWDPSRI